MSVCIGRQFSKRCKTQFVSFRPRGLFGCVLSKQEPDSVFQQTSERETRYCRPTLWAPQVTLVRILKRKRTLSGESGRQPYEISTVEKVEEIDLDGKLQEQVGSVWECVCEDAIYIVAGGRATSKRETS